MSNKLGGIGIDLGTTYSVSEQTKINIEYLYFVFFSDSLLGITAMGNLKLFLTKKAIEKHHHMLHLLIEGV
jgi:hypothetical protein